MEGETKTGAPVAASQKKNKTGLIIGIILAIIIIGVGGYFIYKKVAKPKVTVGKLDPLNPVFDVIHGKTLKATAKDGGSIAVYNEDKVGIMIEIPAGALDKDTNIKLIPIKQKNKDDVPGVGIFPENLSFKKPVKLAFDFSFSSVKNSQAPDNAMGNGISAITSSHIYRYNVASTSLMPQLLDRSEETKTILRAQIPASGLYTFTLNDKFEKERASYALTFKNQTIQTTLESAITLLSKKQKLKGDAKDLLLNAVKRVKADKTPDILALNSALVAEKLYKDGKLSLIPTVQAGDTYAGYLDTICKDPSVGLDTLLSAWKTAQLAHADGPAENCKTRVQNDVAKRVNKLLDESDPTYVDLLKASQDVELVGLSDKFDEAIAKKRHDKAVREAQELLKDPSVDPRILTIALQNLEVFVDDKPDLKQALRDRINSGLSTDVQRVLNDPNASKQDIERAIAKNNFAEGGAETQKKLEDKLKNAKDGAPEKVDETANEQVTEELPAFDWGIIGVAFLKMMGVEDFSEAGIKDWADKQVEGFKELKDYTMQICAFDAAMGASIDCSGYDSQLDSAISDFKNGEYEQAEKIGAIQALPEDQVDNSYDGSNNDSLTVSCISKEEADQIDPQRKLGYTICPEEEKDNTPAAEQNGTTPAPDSSNDSVSEPTQPAQDNSSDSSQSENQNADSQNSSDTNN